jgi:hypothetical protein
MGRPLYERLGFRQQTVYQTYRAPADPTASADPAIRALRPTDLSAIEAADRTATGEDRSALLAAIVEVGSGWLLAEDGDVAGHVLRPPRGGGSTIAPDPAVALRLLAHRRRTTTAAVARCAILDENVEARRLLEEAGWVHSGSHPRLVRGDPLEWQPRAIWGQLNFALG